MKAYSPEHKKRENIVSGEEKYIYVLQQIRTGFPLRVCTKLLFHRLQLQNLFHDIWNGFPEGSTLGQQYNVREKPNVILYTSSINRDDRPPNNSKQITVQYIIRQVVIIYDKNVIDPGRA